MEDLTRKMIENNIAELEEAIHEIYLDGGDMTTEGNMKIDKLAYSIEDFKEML